MFLILLLLSMLSPGDVSMADLERFPDQKACEDAITCNRAYRANLVVELSLCRHREQQISEAVSETDRLYEAWRCLSWVRWYRDDHDGYGYECLLELRERIGWGPYCGGLMPPPVPLWRFRIIER